jgi:hypothetical protein
LLACNPLYLLSAALLLYSFYLISTDSNFLRTEVEQLAFNLGSLQLYELVVVVTAIFLAWRAAYYDSTLLVGLENFLVLVPFILISQAALIQPRLVWGLCFGAGVLAATRSNLLKRFIPRLNLPPSAHALGAVILIVNMALPVLYRILHQSKVGTKPDWGAAYETNQFLWWLLVPALCALSDLLPLARGRGEEWPERPWLPLGFYSLWLLGTGVHLYCLGYVYDFDLRPELLAPALWTLFWVASLRVGLMLPGPKPAWKNALWLLSMLATLVATPQNGKQVFLVLTVLNLGIYGFIYRRQQVALALHLLLISLVALVGGLPEDWGYRLTAHFSRERFIGAGAAIYLLACAAVSRHPKMGFLGALIAATAVSAIGEQPAAFHWAAQIGLAFFLLHSLRWVEPLEEGANVVRWLAGLAWVAHSFVWTQFDGAGWTPCTVGMSVLGVFVACRFLQGRWGSVVLPLASALVVLGPLGHSATSQLKSAPTGLLAVLGSFILFGLGTLAALTRYRWAAR